MHVLPQSYIILIPSSYPLFPLFPGKSKMAVWEIPHWRSGILDYNKNIQTFKHASHEPHEIHKQASASQDAERAVLESARAEWSLAACRRPERTPWPNTHLKGWTATIWEGLDPLPPHKIHPKWIKKPVLLRNEKQWTCGCCFVHVAEVSVFFLGGASLTPRNVLHPRWLVVVSQCPDVSLVQGWWSCLQGFGNRRTRVQFSVLVARPVTYNFVPCLSQHLHLVLRLWAWQHLGPSVFGSSLFICLLQIMFST